MPGEYPNLLDQAKQQYQVLRNMDIAYADNPQEGKGYLEFWPPNEPGAPESPRPQSIPLGKPGVEVYRGDTRPIDILGDVVSHHLINTDPKISSYYDKFRQSLNPSQQTILKEQYLHARDREGERRPYDQWLTMSGLPSYFRGYAFQQWPQQNIDKYYTPEQIKMFDEMGSYLTKGGK